MLEELGFLDEKGAILHGEHIDAKNYSMNKIWFMKSLDEGTGHL